MNIPRELAVGIVLTLLIILLMWARTPPRPHRPMPDCITHPTRWIDNCR